MPLILGPHQFEQLLNARCVARRGAGHVIEARVQRKPITAALIHEASEANLSISSYREAAGELQGSLRATGGYEEAASRLQAYRKDQASGTLNSKK